MSEPKFTPGPWKRNARDNLVGANGAQIVVYDSGLAFAHNRDHEATANGRLIAAAPALYEALKECLDSELRRRKKLKPGAPATTYSEARIARVRAALEQASAKGAK